MIERLLEIWLDSASERSYQAPFPRAAKLAPKRRHRRMRLATATLARLTVRKMGRVPPSHA